MKKNVECILCKHKSFSTCFISQDRMFEIPGKFTVKRCDSCSLVFLDPQPSEKELLKYYPSRKYYSYQINQKKNFLTMLREYLIAHYYHQTVVSRFISIFIKRVPAIPSRDKRGKIMDIGCGSGDTLGILKSLGWDVYGLEIDKFAVRAAQKQLLDNVTLGGYKKLSKFKNNFFDVIRLYHVIEHVDNPQTCLKLIYKKLKKGGKLLIGTPNCNSIVARVFQSYWYNLDSPRHLFLFNEKTIKSILKENCFTVDKIQYHSAGGILGSLQYFTKDKYNRKTDLLSKIWLIILIYPIEWIIDMIKRGDVFVIEATKE